MPVDTVHSSYRYYNPDWEQINDCIAGERTIKKRRTKYLPQPNAEDQSPENTARYDSYVARACFHNVTGQTVRNMVGQCFAIDPVPTMPDEMHHWLEDIDGAGVTATQQAKLALKNVVSVSRCGLWVDFPKTEGPITVTQAEEGGIRPKVLIYEAHQVINWRTVEAGAKSKLSLVVIKEKYEVIDDGYESEYANQYRVLKLDSESGNYIVETYRERESLHVPWDTTMPIDGQGQPFKEIPFMFIGAESNDHLVEKPLMIDISNLNLGHYRNSADYEELVFMVGQPTPYLTGLSQSWVDDVLEGSIMLGSRAAIPLPVGGNAGLLQPAPNTLPFEAMEQKEKLMQALGAKLVEKKEVAKTATEAGIDHSSETSILASCCKNVSDAYGKAFRWAAQFANIQTADPDTEIMFELNREFAVSRMTPEEAKTIMGLEQAGLVTFEEARDKLRSGGIAYLDDDTAKDQLEEKEEEDFAKAQANMKLQMQRNPQFE